MFSEPHRGSFIFTPFRVCKNHDLAGSRIHLEQWSNTGPGLFPQGTLGWGSCPPLTKLGQRVKKQDWRERKFGRSALLKVNINPITLWDWTRGQSSQILHSFCEEALFPNLDGQQHFLLAHPWGSEMKIPWPGIRKPWKTGLCSTSTVCPMWGLSPETMLQPSQGS